MHGSTAIISGASGVSIIGNHFEKNGTDINNNYVYDFNFWGGSERNNSILIQGNYFHNPGGAEFYYGPTTAVTSIGNTTSCNPLHANTNQISRFTTLGDVESVGSLIDCTKK